MRLCSALLVFAVPFLTAPGAEAVACHLPPPLGPVVLRIEGQIRECNEGLEVHFDMAMLEALPAREVRTANPWQEGAGTYRGVLLRDLLEHVKANGTLMTITALNDYSADMDVADARKIDVILAYKRDGRYMPVREKRPLFVIFPFSGQPALMVEQRLAQSVWQVSRITVK
jgi:hypothetical protein